MAPVLDDRVIQKIGLAGNGCGHTILLTKEHYDACRETGRTWYCTVCGCARVYGGKNTVDQLRGELAAAKQREETEKAQRLEAQRKLVEERERLAKERAAKLRLQKRIKNGVCPCCHRTVSQLARHMKSKHPDFATS